MRADLDDMADAVVEQPGHRVALGQIHLEEPEARLGRKLRDPVALQPDTVVIVDVVQSDDLVA